MPQDDKGLKRAATITPHKSLLWNEICVDLHFGEFIRYNDYLYDRRINYDYRN